MLLPIQQSLDWAVIIMKNKGCLTVAYWFSELASTYFYQQTN